MKSQSLCYPICFLCILVYYQRVLGAFVQRKQKSGDVLAEMQVVCTSDAILLKIFTSKPFNGMVYSKDGTTGRNCITEYNASTNMTYRLPLKSCGTSSVEVDDGVEYFNTLVVQPHMRLMTNQGKSYNVRCKYLTRERFVSNVHFNVSASFLMSNNQMPVPAPLYATASMPSCSMKIFKSGQEDAADTVKIGDKLIMMIEIDQQDIYGMRVSNCLVREGLNSMEQQLIDENGCPTDELIMQKFDYTNNFTRASVSFLAHKFPHSNSVYYQCNVRLCVNAGGGCNQPNCANSLAYGAQRRRKRSLDNSTATILRPSSSGSGRSSFTKIPELSFDVYSGLYVKDVDNGAETENLMDLVLLRESSLMFRSYFKVSTIACIALFVSCITVFGMVVFKLLFRNQQVSKRWRQKGLPVGIIHQNDVTSVPSLHSTS